MILAPYPRVAFRWISPSDFEEERRGCGRRFWGKTRHDQATRIELFFGQRIGRLSLKRRQTSLMAEGPLAITSLINLRNPSFYRPTNQKLFPSVPD